ncbi:DUF1343 domain-containing protein [soil metagenome]
MNKLLKIFLTISFLLILSCKTSSTINPITGSQTISDFMLGNEVLLADGLADIQGKRIALVTNQSGIDSKGKHILDNLINSGQNVVKVFTPEHGFRGDDNTDSYKDIRTGVQIISLYGNKKKPESYELKDVDVILYDLQDVGARFYTYINTLYYLMQAADENNKKLIVCDRPEMNNAEYVDGFMLEKENSSFVGLLDIPVAYGMTSGEISEFINAEYFTNSVDLSISKMKGYDRKKNYSSYNLTWINPSPSISSPNTAVCYTGTCFIEGTNVSEGRGTEKPFEIIGAPFVNGEKLAEELNSYDLAGVTFEPVNFVPSAMPNAIPVKYIGEKCGGIFLNVTDMNSFESVKAGIAILITLYRHYPDFEFRKDNFIAKLAGTKNLRKMIESGKTLKEIVAYYQLSLEKFKIRRISFLLY